LVALVVIRPAGDDLAEPGDDWSAVIPRRSSTAGDYYGPVAASLRRSGKTLRGQAITQRVSLPSLPERPSYAARIEPSASPSARGLARIRGATFWTLPAGNYSTIARPWSHTLRSESDQDRAGRPRARSGSSRVRR
jgi:hypothetical protein